MKLEILLAIVALSAVTPDVPDDAGALAFGVSSGVGGGAGLGDAGFFGDGTTWLRRDLIGRWTDFGSFVLLRLPVSFAPNSLATRRSATPATWETHALS